MFSIVSAVYNVERFLPEFRKSLESQRVDLTTIELVVVDDGSTDGSLEYLHNWAAKSKLSIKVLSKENGGQSSARNFGLDHATGEWVTFTDPDDLLDRNYFREALNFLKIHPETSVIGANVFLYFEEGKFQEGHPRNRSFKMGNRIVDLEREPEIFPGSSTVSLMKLDVIQQEALRFNERIRPNFEDGHFMLRYLMATDISKVGLCSSAKYLYRKRSDNSSTLQNSLRHEGRYTSVLELGYIDICKRATERFNCVPNWIQHVILYELSWYFSESEKSASQSFINHEIRTDFVTLFSQLAGYLAAEEVDAHGLRPLSHDARALLSFSYQGEGEVSDSYYIDVVDDEQGLTKISFYFRGEKPDVAFLVDGQPFEVEHKKIRDLDLLHCVLAHEYIAWVPTARTDVVVNGRKLPAATRRVLPPRPRIFYPLKTRIRTAVSRRAPRVIANYYLIFKTRLFRSTIRWWAPLEINEKRYKDSWVFMDRVHDADDSAEHLFDYVVNSHPEINSWFVITKGTADAKRLRVKYGKRVVYYDSTSRLVMLTHAKFVISSHGDVSMVNPRRYTWRFGAPRYKFIFLQHGIIKDDLSRWLNPKKFAMFVTSTVAEQASIADDHTSYVYTSREAQLTGLPRFDRLIEKAKTVSQDEQNLILICPTWRAGLTVTTFTWPRKILPQFWESDYYKQWDAFVRSPELAQAAQEKGLTVAFMPHPNLSAVLEEIELPDHVRIIRYEDIDIQRTFAQAAVLITDYSSVAFNAAYLDRPIVYFHFDKEDALSGGHVGRPGYFDYEEHGFGPVALTVEDAISATTKQIHYGIDPEPLYQTRINETFPIRDGQACARVFQAVQELDRPQTGGHFIEGPEGSKN